MVHTTGTFRVSRGGFTYGQSGQLPRASHSRGASKFQGKKEKKGREKEERKREEEKGKKGEGRKMKKEKDKKEEKG